MDNVPVHQINVVATPEVVQLVIPTGPMLDGIRALLLERGLVMAGPIPVDDPTPTYVLQPIMPIRHVGAEL